MIGHSLSQVGQQVFLKEPKNKKFREITIPASALKKLQAHRKKQQPQRELFGDSYQGDFIFCNPDGSPLKLDTVSASASLLLAAGVLLTDVSKRLGHVNPHVTATVYAHALSGRDDLAATAWEKFQKDSKPVKPSRARKSA